MTTMTKHEKTATPDATRAAKYFENKNEFTTGPVEVSCMIKEGRPDMTIVDVRAAEDYVKGHVPGAVSLPRDRWEKPAGLSKDRTNILYCYTQTCHLAAKAAEARRSRLSRHGDGRRIRGVEESEPRNGDVTWPSSGKSPRNPTRCA